MSYFQKYQRAAGSSQISNISTDAPPKQVPSLLDPRKNSESRQSYLKAFKKYYIDQLISQKGGEQVQKHQQLNKENFCFHEPPLRDKNMNDKSSHNHSKNWKEGDHHKQKEKRDFLNQPNLKQDLGRMNRSKMVAMVNNKEHQLEELLYSSISQVQREMMGVGQGNDVIRENKALRGSIERLKLILKEKLEVALKRNKEELTMMFDQYSSMIRKLLEDKEQLTVQLEECRRQSSQGEQEKAALQEEYENRIRIIVEENNTQVSSTKKQIEEFLDMIIQFEEESNAEKEELQKLREKVVQLEMENDRLKDKANEPSSEGTPGSSLGSVFPAENREPLIDHYSQKIENLLEIVDRLQLENDELNQFLKLCKCSKIKQNEDSEEVEEGQEEFVRKFQKKLIQSEKQFIREEMMLREALRKKDHCIDRLNLVIEQMRKGRYQSVDKLTEEAFSKIHP